MNNLKAIHLRIIIYYNCFISGLRCFYFFLFSLLENQNAVADSRVNYTLGQTADNDLVQGLPALLYMYI